MERELFLTPEGVLDPAALSEERVLELVAIYEASRDRLTKLLASGHLTNAKRFRANTLLRKIDAEILALTKKSNNWARKVIPDTYKDGTELSEELATEYAIVGTVGLTGLLHVQAQAALVDQTILDLAAANNSIKTNMHRYVRLSQQQLLEDRAINRIISRGIVEGQSTRTTSSILLRQLREQMGDAKFITINGRNYDPAKYAELVVRTRTREAATQGTLNAALELGMTLVQIDVHGDACPMCQTRMGRVYSIGGVSSTQK